MFEGMEDGGSIHLIGQGEPKARRRIASQDVHAIRQVHGSLPNH
jgi:hypothetical protein